MAIKLPWPQGHSWDQETIMWWTAQKHAKAQIQVPKKQMGKDCEKIMTLIFQMKSRRRPILLSPFKGIVLTSLLPTRDKPTFDGLPKDTPEIRGKAGNSTQPEVHS